MPKIKIGFILTDCVSANVLMRGQLEFLNSCGAQVDVIAGGAPSERAKLVHRRVARLHAIPFRRQPHLFWDLIALMRLVFVLVSNRYDTLVYSTPKAVLLGSIAAFLTRQPRRVALIRGRAYENAAGLIRRLYIAFDRIAFTCSHQIIFISRSLACAYKADGLDLGVKSRVLGCGSSNGVDLKRFAATTSEQRTASRQRLGYAEEDFVVVAIGRVTPEKGFHEILEVMRLLDDLPQLRFLIVGDLEDQHLDVAMLGLDVRRVRQLPFDPAPENYFAAANLHLFLTHREGFGNVAIEAAAMGVPTFAFDVIGVRDSVTDGVTGELFPFRDTEKVAAAIRSAAADPNGFRLTFANARNHVEARFDQAMVWRRYAKALGVCVNGDKGKSCQIAQKCPGPSASE